MADIALILHFSLKELDALSLDDLYYWHELAMERHKALNKIE